MLVNLTAVPIEIVASANCEREVLVCLVGVAIANHVRIQTEENGGEIAALLPAGTTCVKVIIGREAKLYGIAPGGTGQITVMERWLG